MPKSNRSTQGELEERYALVRKLISRGYNGAKVWKHIRDKTDWGISRQHAYTYYNEVYKQFADDATQIDRAAYFVRTLERLDFIYQKSVSDGDLNSARQATMDVVKLLKLDMPDVDFDWSKEAAEHGLTKNEVKERMKRLLLPEEQPESEGHGENGHRRETEELL